MAAGLRSAAIALPKISTDGAKPNNNRISDRIAILLHVDDSNVPAQVTAGQRLFLFRLPVNRERHRRLIAGFLRLKSRNAAREALFSRPRWAMEWVLEPMNRHFPRGPMPVIGICGRLHLLCKRRGESAGHGPALPFMAPGKTVERRKTEKTEKNGGNGVWLTTARGCGSSH